MTPAEGLARARAVAGYSQDDAAAALGVSRSMISYWESGVRTPTDRQLVALAHFYRLPLPVLLGEEPAPRGDVAAMLLRGGDGAPDSALPGLRDFIAFLDNYANLAHVTGTSIRGLRQSPFISSIGFDTTDDARRKAEEVRAHLRLGIGPVGDVDSVCDLLGITVYRAPLGEDLTKAPSGAFLKHSDVGFAILVNLQMTPGRRRFTVAHEIAHALFHSDDRPYVVSRPDGGPRERFADAFAGEFLMPTEGIRRLLEQQGFGPRLSRPADVILVQRFFRVSYATALVRLRQARLITKGQYEEFKLVRPVILAQALGYPLDDEDFTPDPDIWRITRFPRRFLLLLRDAIQREEISVPSAAAMTGLTIDEVAELASEAQLQPVSPEFGEFEATRVAGGH
jgi:Zn-dependent peptidase ImmA (M78 family)/transcriptional regulator with XRE-family HTH domain